MKQKQQLGQHFLRSAKALAKIVENARLSSSDTVLEIGPGEGVLTKELLLRCGKVIAVEKDSRLVEVLNKRFSTEIEKGRLLIIEKDVRDFAPEEYNLRKGEYKLVANIPYYITGEILREYIGGKTPPSHAVLLVQKEVADRIVEKDGKGSLLSVSIRVFGEPRRVSVVKQGSFSPQPNVDSAILVIENISKNFFSDISEEMFFKVLKTGFSQKRKQIKNTLTEMFGEKNTLESFERCAVSPTLRAEKLSLSEWKCLARELNKISSRD